MADGNHSYRKEAIRGGRLKYQDAKSWKISQALLPLLRILLSPLSYLKVKAKKIITLM
jgi:hypothetical protein